MIKNILTEEQEKETKAIEEEIKLKDIEINRLKREIQDLKCKELLIEHDLKIGEIVAFKGIECVVTYGPWFKAQTDFNFNCLALAPIRVKHNYRADDRLLYMSYPNMSKIKKTYKMYDGNVYCYEGKNSARGVRKDIYGYVCS